MNPPIAVFYHGLFFIGDKLLHSACHVVTGQMQAMTASGLTDGADEIIVGINGTAIESGPLVEQCVPKKAHVTYHGLSSRSENLTLVQLERWLPYHADWYVLYFHAKGATHDTESDYGKFSARWRNCMMLHCVTRWQECVQLLDEGYEAVGCHWLTGMGSDKSQHLFAGNFWWAKASFLLTLPSIFKRERIKMSGIESLESRYEAEVFLGNGPRLPKVKDLEPGHGLGECP